MAFIKNQILKRLSGFVKNFSPDKLQLSVLKGEGTIANIELDEEVLMSTLDLPTWLRIKKATCNWVSIKISWTRLKSQPVLIHLDRVDVEVEMCDQPRDPNRTSALTLPVRPPNTEYNLADMIVDGLTLEINTVAISFRSHAFAAAIELSRLVCASCAPNWAAVKDLKATQIRNPATAEILMFKEITWETTRFEAHAVFDASKKSSQAQSMSVPLRLIANSARIRLALKKRLADNSVVASRLHVMFNDLLWVLTLSQLEAAIVFVRHVLNAVSVSTELERKTMQPAEAAVQPQANAPAQSKAAAAQAKGNAATVALFERFDLRETSYHFYVKYVDLHLCEDGQPDQRLSAHAVQGGGVRITLERIAFDLYPCHKPSGSRDNWLGVNVDLSKRMKWHEKLLEQFWRDLASLRASQLRNSSAAAAFKSRQDALREMCFLMRMKRVQIRTVSTPSPADSPSRRDRPTDLLMTDSNMHIPDEVFSVYLEYGDHYYLPASNAASLPQPDLPVPAPNVYLILYPIRFTFDQPTIIWLTAYAMRLVTQLSELTERIALLEHKPAQVDAGPPPQVRLELLLPSIVLPADAELSDRLHSMQVSVSFAVLTNVILRGADQRNFDWSAETGSEENPLRSVRSVREDLRGQQVYLSPAAGDTDLFANETVERLAVEGRFWFAHVERLWVDCLSTGGRKPLPLVSELTVRLSVLNDETNKRLGLAIDCAHDSFVHLQLGCDQVLFLRRMVDSVTSLVGVVVEDCDEIIESARRKSDLQRHDSGKSLRDAAPEVHVLLVPCALVVTCMPRYGDQSASVHPSATSSFAASASNPVPSVTSSMVAPPAAAVAVSRVPLPVATPTTKHAKPLGLPSAPSVSSLNTIGGDDESEIISISLSEEDASESPELLDLPSDAPSLFDESASNSTVEPVSAARVDEPMSQSGRHVGLSSEVMSICSDAAREANVSLICLFICSPRLALRLGAASATPSFAAVAQCKGITVRELGGTSSERQNVAKQVESAFSQVSGEKLTNVVRFSACLWGDDRKADAEITGLHLRARRSGLEGLLELFGAQQPNTTAAAAAPSPATPAPMVFTGLPFPITARVTDLQLNVISEDGALLSASSSSFSSSISSGLVPINVNVSSLNCQIGMDGAIQLDVPASASGTAATETPKPIESPSADALDSRSEKDTQASRCEVEEQLAQARRENEELKQQMTELLNKNLRLAHESEQLILLVNELQDEIQNVQKRTASNPVGRPTSNT